MSKRKNLYKTLNFVTTVWSWARDKKRSPKTSDHCKSVWGLCW